MQLPPPKDPSEFENLCRDIWCRLSSDPHIQRNGRRGQRQNGVDIIVETADGFEGVQCKVRAKGLSSSEMEECVREAESFSPSLRHLVIATTAPTDARVQETVRHLSQAHAESGSFTVSVRFWDDIRSDLLTYPDLSRKYYPQIFPENALEPPVAEEDFAAYLERFLSLNEQIQAPWVEPSLLLDGETASRKTAVEALMTGSTIVTAGSSGIGKTWLLQMLAADIAVQEGMPILVKAKYYRGSLTDLLGELDLGAKPIVVLLKECRRLGRQVVLLVDGLNECGQGLVGDLLSDLLQLRGSLASAGVLISTRAVPDNPLLGRAKKLLILEPDSTQRAGLREAYGVSAVLEEGWGKDLLHTPMDYRLVGSVEIMSEAADVTKSSFLAAYLEKKVGAPDGPLATLLATLARLMNERLRWALPYSDVIREASQHGQSDVVAHLWDSQILSRGAGQISFWHEIFQNFYEAEWIISRTAPVDLAAELTRPRNHDAAQFVLASLQDSRVLADCVSLIGKVDLMAAALTGHCGGAARAVLVNEVKGLFLRADGELRHLECRIERIGLGSDLIVERTEPWTDHERLVFLALSGEVSNGLFFEEAWDLLLRSEKILTGKVGSLVRGERQRSELVLRYFVLGREALAARLVFPLHSGLRSRWAGQAEETLVARLSCPQACSPVELYVLCLFCREILWGRRDYGIERYFLPLANACRQLNLYHLTLAVLELAKSIGYRIEMSPEQSAAYVVVLEEFLTDQPIINGIVIEALAAFGAVDVGVSVDSASAEIGRVLAATQAPESYRWAASCYCKQFEELFGEEYAEALTALNHEDSVKFFMMAGLGIEPNGFFVTSLLARLIELNSVQAVDVFDRFSGDPANSFIWDDFAGPFILSHVGLAKLRSPLRVPSIASAPWNQWGRLIYTLNRTDWKCSESGENSRELCRACWSEMRELPIEDVFQSWYWIARFEQSYWTPKLAGMNEYRSTAENCQSEAVSLLENAIRARGLEALGEFLSPSLSQDVVSFVLTYLGRWGCESTAVLLEDWAESRYGGQVIAAIRNLRKTEHC